MAALLPALLVLPACARQGDSPADLPAVGATRSPAVSVGNPAPEGYRGRYQATVIVLEKQGHGPRLCMAMMQSNPPKCDGLDIEGWSWDGLAFESKNTTRWGSYLVTGTYDGARLRITEPGRPAGPQLSDPFPEFDFTSPCPPPPGGWTQLDPAKTTEAAVDKAIADASAHPDFAGAWLDQYGGPGTPDNDPTKTVLTLQFTGDLAAHEARARKVWGGSLCVRRAAYSDADLKRIAAEVQTLPGHYEVMVDVTTNSVRLGMYATDAAAQRRLDTRYGPGAVRVAGLLQPID